MNVCIRVSILIILSLSANAVRAQDYGLMDPTALRYFTAENGLLKGIRIDSVKALNGNVVMYPFKTPRGAYNTILPQLDTNGGSWLGSTVVVQPDGTTWIDTYWGDTIQIKTLATLGESWMFYDDTSSRSFVATVTDVDTVTIEGSPDSVKTITIAAHTAAGVDVTDPVHNQTLILSKNHGLYESFSLFTFPYREAGAVYQPMKDFYMDMQDYVSGEVRRYRLTSYLNPVEAAVSDFSVGDVFQYLKYEQAANQSLYTWTIDSVISKVLQPNSVIYSVLRKQASSPNLTIGAQGASFNAQITVDSITLDLVDSTLMPEECGNQYFHYYVANDTSHCWPGPLYKKETNNLSVQGVLNNFEPCGESSTYKVGLGRVSFSKCTDPAGAGTTEDLFYSKKNGAPCGNLIPVGIPGRDIDRDAAFRIYPNPATDQLVINYAGGEFAFQLIDVDGRVTGNGKGVGTVVLGLDGLAPGVYSLRLLDRSRQLISIKKLIVAK